jgi:hypothetical protein
MRWILVAALLAACRGDSHDAGRKQGSASAVSAVPKLPFTEDGRAELRGLDQRIAIHRKEPDKEIGFLLDRATYRGRLEDFQSALEIATAFVAETPNEPGAWKMDARALSAVHRFADARAALAKLQALDADPEHWRDLELSLDEATGHADLGATSRMDTAQRFPNTMTLTLWAANLAIRGEADRAIPLIPKAAERLRDNGVTLVAWLLFQWGRIYELKGDLAIAKDFFADAHRRLPGYVEASAHLAQSMAQTGDTAGALKIIEAALAEERHPELLGIAVQLGRKDLTDEAKREWERYVAALPEAFSDHAARFYLTVDPARALVLAKANLANRDTTEARALVAEAALAAGDPAAACAVVAPLVTGTAPKAQRFVAWRALAKCGRTDEADRLARDLGIAQ